MAGLDRGERPLHGATVLFTGLQAAAQQTTGADIPSHADAV